MRFTQLFLFLLLSQMILAQVKLMRNLNGTYRYPTDSMGNYVTLNLLGDQHFSLIVDNIYDCTPSYVMYGEGRFSVAEGQYLDLMFDSIQHGPSLVKIDTLENVDSKNTLWISVYDHQKARLMGLTLGQSVPRVFFGRTRHVFPERGFDGEIVFTLPNKKRPTHMWVEKATYQRADINLLQLGVKDYQISITLNPWPAVKSLHYFSPGPARLNILSDCQLAHGDNILTKQGCK